MSYLQRNNKRRALRPIVISLVCVMVCVVLGIFLRGPLSLAVQTMLGPGTWFRGYGQGSVSFVMSLFGSKYALEQRIDELQKENAVLKDKIAQLQDIQYLEDLGSTASGTPRIMAHVVMRPPYSPYDFLTISKGSLDGIIAGHKVFPVDRLVPIGKVANVTSRTATVILFSSSGERLPVIIGTSTEEWMAEGKGGGMFEVRIPQSHKVLKGDQVIIPKESSLPFATINEIVSEARDPFQTVRFLLPVSFSSLSIVGIAEHP